MVSEGADSESGLGFSGKLGPKESKLSVLLENWHIWYLGTADSKSGVTFSKFWPENGNNNNE